MPSSTRGVEWLCLVACRGVLQTKGVPVPDSFGKRNREKVKAQKAEVRDERRIARNRRRKGLPPAAGRGQAGISEVLGSPLQGTTGTGAGSSEMANR